MPGSELGGSPVSSSYHRQLAVLGLMVILAGACADDDGGKGITTTTAAVTGSTAAGMTTTGAPSLTLTVEGLTGFQGRLVVGSVFLAEGGGGGPVGSVCLVVDTDLWTGSGVFSTFDPDNPCGKEVPYGEVIAQEGDYSLEVGVYTPGERTPAVCIKIVATIAGPSEVTVAATDMVSNCTG